MTVFLSKINPNYYASHNNSEITQSILGFAEGFFNKITLLINIKRE